MTSPPDTPATAEPLGSRRRNVVFLAVVLGMLLAALDQTVVATALPTVVADLGGAGHQSWIVTSYLLASTVATAVVGKLGDLFGRKRVYAAAVVFFLLGSVLCGLADSMAALVAARALQGIGGGAVMVTAAALIGEVIPLRERGRYQGALGAVFGVTTVIGPLLGGFFTDHLTWRWAFWINVPVALVVLAVAMAALPSTRLGGRPRIDVAGIALVALGAGGLTLATSWGGTEHPWLSPVILGLVGASVMALAAFVAVERRAAEPILPIRLFADPVFAVCSALAVVVGFAMLGALTFLPTFMQFVDGVSATESGLRTLPMVAGLLLTSMGSGVLVGRTGRYKVFPVVGTAVMAVGFALMSTMDAATPVGLQSLYLFVLGVGIGMCMQVLVLVVQNTVAFSDLGVATSGVTFFRTIGSSFGAAVFGSLFAMFLGDRLAAALVSAAVPAGVAQSPEQLAALDPARAAPIVAAYADALGQVFLWAVPVALVGFVLALLLREVPLRETTPAPLDLGEGFGMPVDETPDQVLERAVARLIRGAPGWRLRAAAATPECELDVAGLWGVVQVYRHAQALGHAELGDIAASRRIPVEVIAPVFDRLVADGFALRDGDRLWLTRRGARSVDVVSAHIVTWLVERIAEADGSDRARRPDRDDVQAALERIALRMVAQRGLDDDQPALTGARA